MADQWAAEGRPNLWGTVPKVVEMQSEGGAAGAVHGALQAGALTTTFTASQGLLLMIPNMYKIAGRTDLRRHPCRRPRGGHPCPLDLRRPQRRDGRAGRPASRCSLRFGAGGADFALIAQAATLEARIPFLHFFDGFRTSHEVTQIETLTDDRSAGHDRRRPGPRPSRARPVPRPSRDTRHRPEPGRLLPGPRNGESLLSRLPDDRAKRDGRLAELTGRQYHLFDYYGDPEAERVIVLMGSGAEAVAETVGT